MKSAHRLTLPGSVKEGDYILSEWRTVDVSIDPYAAFEGTAGITVILKVNNKPSLEGSREVVIETTTAQERRLKTWNGWRIIVKKWNN
jgi:tricorn protease